jgi:MFS family permease
VGGAHDRGGRALLEPLTAARRNLLVLAAGLAALYGMIELALGVSAITVEDTGGPGWFEGAVPAVFLACAGTSALAAGAAMDRSGSRPVLAAGFAAGIAGCLLAALGVRLGSVLPVLAGFALAGAAAGGVLLSRASAAQMFPPEHRPRAIAQVLFGAVFGALLGPLVFSPLLGEDSGGSALELAWLGGAGFMLAGLGICLLLRPDPSELAVGGPSPGSHGAFSIREGIRLSVASPGVRSALFAALASWACMVTVMSLVGSALVDHGHEHGAVFPILAAHFVGMFAFFAVVGPVIERIGGARAIVIGLLVLAASSVSLPAVIDSAHLTGLVLFGVGLGWSLSFVAATAELSDRAPAGRQGTLIGFADLLGGLTGAALVVAGGVALDAAGVGAVGIGAATLPLLAAVWFLVAPSAGGPASAGEAA